MEINSLAPIALFVFNRLDHTRRTVAALQKNILADQSDLIIYSDGPKDTAESRASVLAVREYLTTIAGFKSVKIIEREKNFGLAQSIISGVSEVIAQSGKIIVLEDDMLSSRHFLEYMNEGLTNYQNDESVISIHGYIYPVQKTLPETFFLKGADCWGWATWQRGWELFEADGQKLLDELIARKSTQEFDFSGTQAYTQMLRDQIAGKNNSWAIRWYASAFLKNKLTLYPGRSLISNIGFDNSGTHCGITDDFGTPEQVENVKIDIKKIEIKEDSEAKQIISDFFRTQACARSSWQSRLKRAIKKILAGR